MVERRVEQWLEEMTGQTLSLTPEQDEAARLINDLLHVKIEGLEEVREIHDRSKGEYAKKASFTKRVTLIKHLYDLWLSDTALYSNTYVIAFLCAADDYLWNRSRHDGRLGI